MPTTVPSRSELPAEPPPLILAELVETRSRAGAQMFIGTSANGLRVMLVRHEEHRNAGGERVRIWRLLCQERPKSGR